MATRPDADARSALDAAVRRTVTFCWLDIAGDPIRVTDAPYNVTFPDDVGDEDLAGQTFEAVRPDVVSIGPVKAKEGGTDTVTLTLSGLAGVDDELMTAIGNRANWAGRDGRLWRMMRDPETLAPIGNVWGYYTGYMTVPVVVGDRTHQTVALDLESYLGFFTQASNRGYLSLSNFDPDDHSAELAIALGNGAGVRR